MRRWLEQYAVIGIFLLLVLGAGIALADITLPVTAKTVTVHGLCDNWKAWRTVERNLWVGCGAAVPPAGAVELRAYYIAIGVPR